MYISCTCKAVERGFFSYTLDLESSEGKKVVLVLPMESVPRQPK